MAIKHLITYPVLVEQPPFVAPNVMHSLSCNLFGRVPFQTVMRLFTYNYLYYIYKCIYYLLLLTMLICYVYNYLITFNSLLTLSFCTDNSFQNI